MFFNKCVSKDKIIKWYTKAISDLDKKGFNRPTNIHYEFDDGYFVIIDDAGELEFNNLQYKEPYSWGNHDNYIPFSFHSVVGSIGIRANIKKYENVYEFMREVSNTLQGRNTARKNIATTRYLRDAGFTVQMGHVGDDFRVCLQPVDLETYLKCCTDHMADKSEQDFPFILEDYRAYLIDKFAFKGSGKTVTAECPSIVALTVDEWYGDEVCKKRKKLRIEKLNATCQNVIDEIKNKIAEEHQVVAISG